MLTPQEVAEKVFPKSGLGSGGYKMSSVDEFLDALTEDYKTLYAENITLKAKLKVLAEKAEEYRATEDAMRNTLYSAQRTAENLIKEAQQEKENVVAAARKESAEKIAQYEAEAKEVKAKLENAKVALASYIARSKEVIEQQMNYLNDLPEAPKVNVATNFPTFEEEKEEVVEEVTEEAEEIVEEPVSTEATAVYAAATPEMIEEALKEKEEEEEFLKDIGEAVEELMENKQEVIREPVKKDGPGEFTKSLEELQWQFGKNYDVTQD